MPTRHPSMQLTDACSPGTPNSAKVSTWLLATFLASVALCHPPTCFDEDAVALAGEPGPLHPRTESVLAIKGQKILLAIPSQGGEKRYAEATLILSLKTVWKGVLGLGGGWQLAADEFNPETGKTIESNEAHQCKLRGPAGLALPVPDGEHIVPVLSFAAPYKKTGKPQSVYFEMAGGPVYFPLASEKRIRRTFIIPWQQYVPDPSLSEQFRRLSPSPGKVLLVDGKRWTGLVVTISDETSKYARIVDRNEAYPHGAVRIGINSKEHESRRGRLEFFIRFNDHHHPTEFGIASFTGK